MNLNDLTGFIIRLKISFLALSAASNGGEKAETGTSNSLNHRNISPSVFLLPPPSSLLPHPEFPPIPSPETISGFSSSSLIHPPSSFIHHPRILPFHCPPSLFLPQALL